ncbi:DUF2283 domain-containing protein [Amycolatopsis sp. NBC_00438]|uniref:DUF2283 domain-containing protein n=1 Tax=Amycolatopsis sp. NBC_00438 TaxID=2903558 RepID=UPI002E208B85
MAEPSFSVEIDQVAEAAYVRFNQHDVVETKELADEINVDLDKHGMAVGIELLDLSAPIPLDKIAQHVHVDSRVLALLENIARNQTRMQAGTSASAINWPFETQPFVTATS